MATVLLLTLNQKEFHSVQNQKENRHHDHILFNVKENKNIVFSAIEIENKSVFLLFLPSLVYTRLPINNASKPE